MDCSWMYNLKRSDNEFLHKMEEFISCALNEQLRTGEETICCPCRRCNNRRILLNIELVKDHMSKQVRLVPYDPRVLDTSVLWSESKDLGDGFRCIRKVNDISLNFDVLHGDKDHGGVRDGNVVVLYEWFKKSMNQRWKIVPYGRIIPNVNELQLTRNPTIRIYSKAALDYSLTVRNGHVVLAPADPSDDHQHWFKDFRFCKAVNDEDGFPSFALVNKATGLAVEHAVGKDHAVRMVAYNPEYLDESILWTESNDLGGGFRCIRMVNNIRFNFDAFHGDDQHGGVQDGTPIFLYEWFKGKNQRWKTVPYY